MINNSNIVDAPLHEPESDYHFKEGSYFPPQFKIMGVVFILIGIALCLQLNILGIILLLLGLVPLFAKKELSISFSLCRFRQAFAIFKFRMGSWESLPEFESISVFSAKKSQDMNVGSQSATASFTEIEVNLVYKRSRRLTAYTTNDYSGAMKIAKMFAGKFDLRIYDATAREGRWLD
jgi:hypothetical protein